MFFIPICLRSLELKPTEAMIEQLTVAWKDKPESRITMEEFIPIYNDLRDKCGQSTSSETLTNLLSLYDRDSTGSITLADLSLMLQNTGEKMSSADVDDILSGLDMSEGKIAISDIVRLLVSV
ncbi:unnamed protein product [Auanema sp. JU1783]|nr:unnamed protein product [Auanema sp. JU1783]